jgi:methyl-accepting chemotaxis protein
MKLFRTIFITPSQELKKLLREEFKHHLGAIMATMEQHAQALRDLKVQLVKSQSEVASKLQALADALANQGNTNEEVDTAMSELTAAVKASDDQIEDIAPPP